MLIGSPRLAIIKVESQRAFLRHQRTQLSQELYHQSHQPLPIQTTRRNISLLVASSKKTSSSLSFSSLLSQPSLLQGVLFTLPKTLGHQSHNGSVETMATTTTAAVADSSGADAVGVPGDGDDVLILPFTLEKRIQIILSQNRQVLNFEHYTPSSEHLIRMKQLAQILPELYNNPNITPRSKWFQHKLWHRNSQMPPYHIHFRHELQRVIQYLYQVIIKLQQQQQQQQQQKGQPEHVDPNEISQMIRSASSLFQRSMRGLNGHVSIEEYACFPLYQKTFPTVNVQFLYDDHQELHSTEQHAKQQLSNLVKVITSSSSLLSSSSSSLILETLQSVVDFDDMLLAHLGEEEEIVVPMSLTEKRIHF